MGRTGTDVGIVQSGRDGHACSRRPRGAAPPAGAGPAYRCLALLAPGGHCGRRRWQRRGIGARAEEGGPAWRSGCSSSRQRRAPSPRIPRHPELGVRDLRYGSIVDEDCVRRRPGRVLLAGPLPRSALPPGPGVLIRCRDGHPGVGRAAGDPSWAICSSSTRVRRAVGPRRSMPFEIEHGRHIGRMHHFRPAQPPEISRGLCTHAALVRGCLILRAVPRAAGRPRAGSFGPGASASRRVASPTARRR